MKKILFFLFAFSTLFAVAQNKGTIETRALMKAYSQSKSVDRMTKKFLDRYPIRIQKDGTPCIGATAKINASFDAAALEREGIKVTSRVASIVAMRVPLAKLHILSDYSGIESFSIAHKVAPMMDRARVDTRTDSVHEGLGLPMPFDGEGVLIGITDWGFDYTHPNLNRKNNPRIEGAWDHFKLSGPAPEGFDYGTVYLTPTDIMDAKGDTSGLYKYGTHGTHVAGICGGLGTTRGEAIGQAPGAHYLLGSWYLDEASWLDQVAWMKKMAQQANKRIVINSSWGMYTFSTLDGTSLLSQAINAYSDSGIVFVTSAGTNGDAKYHLQRTFGTNDTLRSLASYLSGGVGQALIYWGETYDANPCGNMFKAGFILVNTSTNQCYYSPFYSTENEIEYLDTFIVAGNDTIGYDIMVEESNPFDGRSHVLLNVEQNRSYRLIMCCTADSGVTVNIWNVGNVENHAGNTGCDFSPYAPLLCMAGDNSYGIGEPACAEKTISVAAHAADYYQDDSTYIVGSIAYFSSLGPTLDGRNKPEISAPGQGVISSVSYWRDPDGRDAIYTVRNAGRTYEWSGMSGTSMSSPNVSGIVALMLQANPNLSVNQVRDILFRTARNDSKTGPLHQLDSISPIWGHGKADAMRAVAAAYDLLSVEEAAVIRPNLVVYPSPADDHITIVTGSNKPQQASIYSIDGRCMMQVTVNLESTVDISSLPQGIYFVRVQDIAGIRTAKIIKK
ncbi:MAG: S8 family peptidase [Bacteroidales bacterium]|nr:S8 family peptidase [Bacteroidales bacterium]